MGLLSPEQGKVLRKVFDASVEIYTTQPGPLPPGFTSLLTDVSTQLENGGVDHMDASFLVAHTIFRGASRAFSLRRQQRNR